MWVLNTVVSRFPSYQVVILKYCKCISLIVLCSFSAFHHYGNHWLQRPLIWWHSFVYFARNSLLFGQAYLRNTLVNTFGYEYSLKADCSQTLKPRWSKWFKMADVRVSFKDTTAKSETHRISVIFLLKYCKKKIAQTLQRLHFFFIKL